MWAMFCHLSGLLGWAIPVVGHVAGPLIIWQVKKNDIPSIDEHGREATNFQLSLMIYLLAGGIIAFIASFACIGFLLFPALGAVAIAGAIFTVIGGIKANEGVVYRYPMNLRLIK